MMTQKQKRFLLFAEKLKALGVSRYYGEGIEVEFSTSDHNERAPVVGFQGAPFEDEDIDDEEMRRRNRKRFEEIAFHSS